MTAEHGARKTAHTNARAFAIVGARQRLSTGRQGDRHGQGSDAQQQGKEETEGRQEPQEGRRGSGQSVRDGQDAGWPKPEQQEIDCCFVMAGQKPRDRATARATVRPMTGAAATAVSRIFARSWIPSTWFSRCWNATSPRI